MECAPILPSPRNPRAERLPNGSSLLPQVLGGMNGTLIEALIANGTIAHPGEAVDAKLVKPAPAAWWFWAAGAAVGPEALVDAGHGPRSAVGIEISGLAVLAPS